MTRLFETHSDELLAFLARRTFDSQVAFDLLGETFAAAFEARAKCRARSDSELHGWLFGIARNQLNLFYRDGFIERRALSKLAVEPIALSDESFERVERLADLTAARVRLAGALAELSPEHREVLQLRVIEERSYGDVAERLAVSEQVRPCARQSCIEELARRNQPAPSWKEYSTMPDNDHDRNSIPELAKLRDQLAASFARSESLANELSAKRSRRRRIGAVSVAAAAICVVSAIVISGGDGSDPLAPLTTKQALADVAKATLELPRPQPRQFVHSRVEYTYWSGGGGGRDQNRNRSASSGRWSTHNRRHGRVESCADFRSAARWLAGFRRNEIESMPSDRTI